MMHGRSSLFVRIKTGSILTATDFASKSNTIATDLFRVFGNAARVWHR